MIVLDTNVISELMRKQAASTVVAWADRQPTTDLYLTAITTAELLYGIARLPDGKRKETLAEIVQALIADEFSARILPFDAEVAAYYAQIAASRERGGRPIAMADAQIAAICRFHGARLATRNTKDFAKTGVQTINPWDASS